MWRYIILSFLLLCKSYAEVPTNTNASPSEASEVSISGYAPPKTPEPTTTTTNVSTVSNGSLSTSEINANCTSIANNIIWTSKQTASEQLFPWENANWLEKHLGTARIKKNTSMGMEYGWSCQISSTQMIIIIFISINQNKDTGSAVICNQPSSECVSYLFIRDGKKLTGLMYKPQNTQ